MITHLIIFMCVYSTINAFIITDGEVAREIVGIEGQRVLLPCESRTHLALPHTAIDERLATLILFYRDNQSKPLYSFDVRSNDDQLLLSKPNNFSVAKQSTATSIALYRNQSTSGLVLDPVHKSDEGLYRCRIDFQYAPTRNLFVYLHVLVSPEKPKIYLNTKIISGKYFSPVNEGADIKLACVSVDRFSQVKLEWHFNGRVLKGDMSLQSRLQTHTESPGAIPPHTHTESPGAISPHTHTEYERVYVTRNELTLSPLTRDHHQQTITCVASKTNLTRPASTTHFFLVNYGPDEISLFPRTKVMFSGRTYHLQCNISLSYPTARITWHLTDPIGRHEVKQINGTMSLLTASRFSLNLTHLHDKTLLTCKAENFALGRSVNTSILLNVKHGPIVEIKLGVGLSLNNIRESTDVYFDCLIQANPLSNTIRWFHNSRFLKTRHKASNVAGFDVITMSYSSLIIRNISHKSIGNYSCEASNDIGTRRSSSMYLDVKYAPICVVSQKFFYPASIKDKLQISCRIRSNPVRVSFRWKFYNSVKSKVITPSVISTDNDTSILTYQPMSEQDFGTLLCTAQNSFGLMYKPCRFRVFKATRPQSVTNCRIHDNVTAESSSVVCTSGHDGGKPQSFILQVRDRDSDQLLANISSLKPRFRLSGTYANNSTTALVYARNVIGLSAPWEIRFTPHYMAKNKSTRDFLIEHFHSKSKLILLGFTIMLITLLFLFLYVFFKRCFVRNSLISFKENAEKRMETTDYNEKNGAIKLFKNMTTSSNVPHNQNSFDNKCKRAFYKSCLRPNTTSCSVTCTTISADKLPALNHEMIV